MTLMELLQVMEPKDQSTRAVYPDGSRQSDVYELHISLSGHGSLLDADVERIIVGRGSAFILADGGKGA